MLPKIRAIICLPIVLILVACQVINPAAKITLTQPLPTISSTPQPTDTLQPTFTSVPTLTPTLIQPSLTPTISVSPTTAPTQIPVVAQQRIFDSLWTIVNDTYVYPDFNGLDWNAIRDEYRQIIANNISNDEFYQALSELVYRLGDDHSYFIDPQQVAQQEAEYEGEHDYVGIGIMASAVPERQRAVIISVFPNSPAEAAGLKPRDSIISVDSSPILDEDGFLRDILRGPEGTTIKLLVQTPGEVSREVQITRQRISGNIPVFYDVITTPEGKRIGYILLITFMDSTVDEQVVQALKTMTAHFPLDGLILDNRMNEGGSSTVLEPMLSYFLGGKVGTFVSHNDEYPLAIKLKDINGSSKVPLVVLVGPGTASFGEIFAGVLQDFGRAYLIGTTTGGNVEVLWGYDFEDGSQLWLASETFRPMNHPEADWEKSGIIPDLTVSADFDQFSQADDPLIVAAIRYLSGR